jgi:uncharacterized protein YkwD
MKRLIPVLLLMQICVGVFASDANTEITPENVLALMNVYRAEAGLAPLAMDARLTRAANDRMRHMEDVGYWSHEAPDGMSPFVWMTARDYDFARAAENLAAGFDTVGFLVSSWMESPGHRENIMNPELEDCGIAVIEGSTTGRATGKSIVVLFGAQQGLPIQRAATRP